MRLIDADDFKIDVISQSNTGRESYSTDLICEMIDETPTAYDIDKVVEELDCDRCESCSFLEVCAGSICCKECHKKTIEIVKHEGVSDDVCKWSIFDNSLTGEPQWVYETTCGKYVGEEHTSKAFVYCPYCGKKIKVV